ncbi:glycosyltransferase family 4 protein [Actinoplanes sp. NPDC051411]|uniref:glycosyltransferase family 4 protein n=1 Tax=Actinoplanes sp. NPDC051411 TaxID=3155522 RepID=UPI00343B6058
MNSRSPITVAIVLLSYTPDAPAGLERSVASLQQGLCELGHRAIIVTTAANVPDGGHHDLVGLTSINVPSPATEEQLLAALVEPGPVCAELTDLLTRHHTDVVCWADASWGLGYLAPAPPGVRTALNLAVMRTDPLFRQALDRQPTAVITPSPYMIGEADTAGYDTAIWHQVPNALLTPGQPPNPARREQLRRSGPVRIAARAEPHKGILELISAVPDDLDRPVEVALAAAGFEYWPGMQNSVIAECTTAAHRAPGQVLILPPLPWQAIPSFFAGAAVTIISTTSPESWCNSAAEALSAGTPVIGYDFGHVPTLTGPAGVMIPPVPPGEPATALWQATTSLLRGRDAYHHASRHAPAQVAAHTPTAAAQAFLAAVGL